MIDLSICEKCLYWFHAKLCISILKVGEINLFLLRPFSLFVKIQLISFKMAKEKTTRKGL